MEYTTGENANLTYIVNAEQDVIYIDDFYDAYAWVLDSNSEGVSLYDYHNSSEENLVTKPVYTKVIYTESENVNIGDILGTQRYSSIDLPYKVIDVSANGDIKQSALRIYEDGNIIASKGKIGGLNISDNGSLSTDNGNFSLSSDGNLIAKSGVFSGFLRMPFKTFDEGATNISDELYIVYTVSNNFNLIAHSRYAMGGTILLKLPNGLDYSGAVLTIYAPPKIARQDPTLTITCETDTYIYHPSQKSEFGLARVKTIDCGRGGLIQFLGISEGSYTFWYVISDMISDATFELYS